MRKLILILFLTVLIFSCSEKTTEPEYIVPEVSPPSVGEGTEADPYQIASLENLYWISQNEDTLDKHFIQTNDIDASETKKWICGGWTPIGHQDYPFKGEYDGGGNRIEGLYINRLDIHYNGLFAYVEDAAIHDLTLADIDVSGNMYTGGLIGFCMSTEVDNISTSGKIAGFGFLGGLIGATEDTMISNSDNNCQVYSYGDDLNIRKTGGVVGYATDSEIKNCFNTGNIVGYRRVGGLVGSISDTDIENCHSSGNVSGMVLIGGLVGDVFFGQDLIIKNSSNTGNVSGSSNVGGFIGRNDSTIEQCYSEGVVEGEFSVGGFVGLNRGVIKSSFGMGNVSGDNRVGGFVGSSSFGEISNCFSRCDVTRIQGSEYESIGSFAGIDYRALTAFSYSTGKVQYLGNEHPTDKGFIGENHTSMDYWKNFFDLETTAQSEGIGAEAKTTAEMQTEDTFTDAGWDFDQIWTIDGVTNDGYPYLKWMRK
jgi:hypothetical protein